MPTTPPKLTKKRLLSQIKDSRGNVLLISQRVKCSRRAVYDALNRWPDAKEALEVEREKRIDWVESKLDQAIDEGNIAAIIFFLKTQGRSRGYVERQELTGAEGEPITVNWKLPTPEEIEVVQNGLPTNGARR